VYIVRARNVTPYRHYITFPEMIAPDANKTSNSNRRIALATMLLVMIGALTTTVVLFLTTDIVSLVVVSLSWLAALCQKHTQKTKLIAGRYL